MLLLFLYQLIVTLNLLISLYQFYPHHYPQYNIIIYIFPKTL